MLSGLYPVAQQLEGPVGINRGDQLPSFFPHLINFLCPALNCVMGFSECSLAVSGALLSLATKTSRASKLLGKEWGGKPAFFIFFFSLELEKKTQSAIRF